MTARELLNKLPTVFNQKAAGVLSCTIQFDTAEPAYLTIDNGECRVVDGVSSKNDLVITISDPNLIELLTGKMNPVTGLMFRKLKAEGDLDLGVRLTSLFDFKKM